MGAQDAAPQGLAVEYVAVSVREALAAAAAWLAYNAAIIVIPVLVALAKFKRRKRK